MKRVCFLLNNEFVLDNRVEREAETLCKAGYEVHLLCSHAPHLPRREQKNELRIHRLFKKRLPNYRPFSFRHVKGLLNIVTRFPAFDVVHAHDANTLLLGWLLAKAWNARLVYDSHEWWAALFQEEKKQAKQSLKKSRAVRTIRNLERFSRLERWLLNHCDALISVNDFLCDELLAMRTRKACLVQTIRNMPGLQGLSSAQQPKRFHQHFNLPESTKIILFQGGIKEDRGSFQFLNSLKLIADPAVVGVFMGPWLSVGFERQLSDWLAAHPAMRQRVFYKEPVYGPEFLDWTASADLGIAPILNTHASYYYCLPNKLFEYIQAELPCAVSDFPEMKRIVDGYGVGFTFNPANPQEMAQRIEAFFRQPEQAAHYRERARLAKQELNWENEQQKLLALYRQLTV